LEKHPVIFAGAGPGAPDLITVRGMKALEQAEYILYAGSLVPEAVLTWTKNDAAMESSAGLHLDQMVGKMARAWEQGLRVVRLHTGDPSLYGAIKEQMDRLDRLGIPCKVIPGVTAAFAAAAALKAEYTVPGISQTLIFTRISGRTPVPEKESLLSLAGHNASMVMYLSSGMAEEVAEVLSKAYGPSAPCAVAYRVSQPEQMIIRTTVDKLVNVMAENNINRHTLIITGPFLEAAGNAQSLLYHKQFSHGYREKS